MAHLGKDYPVHFRRDWSPDVGNYRIAHARDYFFICRSASGTIGGSLPVAGIRCKAFNERTADVPEWRSAPTNVNGRSVTVIITLTSLQPSNVMGNRIEIFDAIQGSVARGTGVTAATSGYRILAGHFDQSWKPHPALFDSSTGVIWNCEAARWSDF